LNCARQAAVHDASLIPAARLCLLDLK